MRVSEISSQFQAQPFMQIKLFQVRTLGIEGMGEGHKINLVLSIPMVKIRGGGLPQLSHCAQPKSAYILQKVRLITVRCMVFIVHIDNI